MSEDGSRTRVRSTLETASRSYVVLVAIALVIGLAVAPFAWSAATGGGDSVAVVPLAGTIDGPNAADVNQRLVEAREDPSIDAVVLVINSGGGLATASNELYMQLSRTAEVMPVIAVIDGSGLSGAYHAAVAADYIYAKPASNVGSVGSILVPPEQTPPIDRVITSGPQKRVGQTERGWEYQVAASTASFASTVLEERGDALELSEAELRQARIYNGVNAIELGLADEVGDVTRAIQHAADAAGLAEDDYAVERLPYNTSVEFTTQSAYLAADVDGKTLVEAHEVVDLSHSDPAPTVLMMPAGAFAGADEEAARTTEGTDGV